MSRRIDRLKLSGTLACVIGALPLLHCAAPALSGVTNADDGAESSPHAGAADVGTGEPSRKPSAVDASDDTQTAIDASTHTAPVNDAALLEPGVWVDVEGLDGTGLEIEIGHSGWDYGTRYRVASNGRSLLYRFSSEGDLVSYVIVGRQPAAPYELCTTDFVFDGNTLEPTSDHTVHVHCAHRFSEAPPAFAPTASVSLPLVGEPSTLVSYDTGLVFAVSDADSTPSALVAFDGSGIQATTALDHHVVSLFSQADTNLSYLAYEPRDQTHLIISRDGFTGSDVTVGTTAKYAYLAAWSPSRAQMAIATNYDDNYGPTSPYAYMLDAALSRASSDLGWLDRDLFTTGGLAFVEQAGVDEITAASFSGDGLDVSLWSRSPRTIAGMIHLSGLSAATSRPSTLSYAAGKVWVASVDVGQVIWRGYDVAW